MGHAGIFIELSENFKETVFRFDKNFEVAIPDSEGASQATKECTNEGTNEGTGAGIYCKELGIEVSIPLGFFATVFLVRNSSYRSEDRHMFR